MSRGEDAITALAETLDALDEHLRDSDAKARRSERNRLSMLHVHAGFAMYIGPFFALVGRDGMRGPTWAVVRQIPGAPYTLGVLLFVGGAILAVATWYRRVPWEITGLCILLTWYLTIALSFGLGVLGWYAGWLDGPRPAPYAHGVYLHFAAIMAVHWRTLLRIRRAQRVALR